MRVRILHSKGRVVTFFEADGSDKIEFEVIGSYKEKVVKGDPARTAAEVVLVG